MTADRSAAAALGRLASRIEERLAPDEVRRRARAVVADVLATGASAAGRPDVSAARDALVGTASDGPCTVIGSARTAPPLVAALANALPIAAEQRQDGHRLARGHPGSHVVPAVLAVAESTGASGQAVLSAVLAGYEVGARVGIAMGGTPPGVHDIATWGTLGAAAGVAHLCSAGDAETVAAAIDLAAALPVLPDAETVFSGATGQHLLLGVGVQLAVTCGQAAVAGLRPMPGTLERHFARWSAADWSVDRWASSSTVEWPVEGSATTDGSDDGGSASEQYADRWLILEGYLKRHPTCAHLHGVNDAVEDLAAVGPLEAAQIEAVTVRTYRAAAAFDGAEPANELAARFSIPWTVAAGLTRRGLSGAFAREVWADDELRALARRVRVEADPVLEDGYPDGRPALVVVRLRDGSTREARAGRPRGDGPDALEDADVRDKPRRLLTAVADGAWADAVLAAVERLAEDGVPPLTAALRALTPPRG